MSLRDLVARHGVNAAELMTSPAQTIAHDTTVAASAHQMAEGRLHSLVVIDGHGRAVGIVSAGDLLRELVDLPPLHPAAFPHLDPETGVQWTDDHRLDLREVSAAPDGPGVLALLEGGYGRPDRLDRPGERGGHHPSGYPETPSDATLQPIFAPRLCGPRG